MIRKIALLLPMFLMLTCFLIPQPVQAADKLRVLDSSAEVNFPDRLTFKLSAESDVDITDIRLCYRIERIDFARVISEAYIDFVPDNRISIDWSLEMRKIGGLPPGSSLEYWWKVRDSDGEIITTPPANIVFDDNRYSWHSLTEGEVTLYWYQGDEYFAEDLMQAAQQALERLKQYTATDLEQPVELFIYASSRDLQGSMIYPQEWTGGVAFTRYGIMAIGIAPENIEWGKRAIAHELTHLVTHQITLNPYNEIPTWLDEGLAVRSEGPLSESLSTYLDYAIAEEDFISVQSLSSPFSAYAGEAALSYAESYSLVEFLIETYGEDKMHELLFTFREGSTYDGALKKVYGFGMDGLDKRWQDWIMNSGEPEVISDQLPHQDTVVKQLSECV
ncbi:MAG: peptidase MA family metallohydrolase [Dehalococcoidales bacterium]